MITGAFRSLVCVTLLAGTAPICAKDSKLRIEPISGLSLTPFTEEADSVLTERLKLTNPSTDGLVAPPRYSLQRDGSDLTGKRARLVVPVGDNTRVVASSGKIQRRVRPGDANGAVGIGSLGRLETGKQLGAGVEHRLGPLELGAHYQFTRITSGMIDPTGGVSERGAERMMSFSPAAVDATMPDVDSRNRGHSLQATARIRF